MVEQTAFKFAAALSKKEFLLNSVLQSQDDVTRARILRTLIPIFYIIY